MACAPWAARRKVARKGSDATTVRADATISGRYAVRSRFWAIAWSAMRSATKPATRASCRLWAARAANVSASKKMRSR